MRGEQRLPSKVLQMCRGVQRHWESGWQLFLMKHKTMMEMHLSVPSFGTMCRVRKHIVSFHNPTYIHLLLSLFSDFPNSRTHEYLVL